jgi:hypothetical protein
LTGVLSWHPRAGGGPGSFGTELDSRLGRNDGVSYGFEHLTMVACRAAAVEFQEVISAESFVFILLGWAEGPGPASRQ